MIKSYTSLLSNTLMFIGINCSWYLVGKLQ